MGRAPCCDKANVKKGPWSPEEDAKLKQYIETHGTGGNWISLPQKAGLRRCGKSCRLRWLNYLRPNIKRGEFSDDEDRIICTLFASFGSRWSIIAAQLPGRTDNDIKNYWNTKLKKKLFSMVPQSETTHHHHLHHHASFLSLLQSSSSPSSSLPYNCSNNTYQPPRSFPGSEVSYSSSFSNISASVLQPHQLRMFGCEASCSSSDGNCSGNQISHSKELDYKYGGAQGSSNSANHGDQQIGNMHSYFFNEGNENQKVMASNGLWGETPLDYGVEEIKQLISTSNCNSIIFYGNNEEKIMYN